MLSCVGGNCSSFILNFVLGRCVWKITQIRVFLDDHTEQSARRKVQYGAGKSVCSKSNMSLWLAIGIKTWVFAWVLAEMLPLMLRESRAFLSLPSFLPLHISSNHDPALQNTVPSRSSAVTSSFVEMLLSSKKPSPCWSTERCCFTLPIIQASWCSLF